MSVNCISFHSFHRHYKAKFSLDIHQHAHGNKAHNSYKHTSHIHPPISSLLSSYAIDSNCLRRYYIAPVQQSRLHCLHVCHHYCSVHNTLCARWLPHEESTLIVAPLRTKNTRFGWTLVRIWNRWNGPQRKENNSLSPDPYKHKTTYLDCFGFWRSTPQWLVSCKKGIVVAPLSLHVNVHM